MCGQLKIIPPLLPPPLPKVLEIHSVQELWHLPRRDAGEAQERQRLSGLLYTHVLVVPIQNFLGKG